MTPLGIIVFLNLPLPQNISKMTYFRSEPMTYCQTLMPREAAWSIMNKLGQLDMIHIIKLPLSYESPFAPNLKRCDETLTRIQHIKLFLSQFHHQKLIPYRNPTQMFNDFDHAITQSKTPGPMFMNQIQDQVYKTSKFFDQQKHEFDRIKEKRNNLIQSAALSLSLHDVVKKKEVFEDTYWNNDSVDYKRKSSKLECKMGLINRQDQMMLQKMVFRVSKGNAWVENFEIKYEEMNKVFDSDEDYEFVKGKIVFLILFQSGEHAVIYHKIAKILGSLDCYIEPEGEKVQLENLIDNLRKEESEINGLYRITKDSIKHYVNELYEPRASNEQSYLTFLEMYTVKEKTLYQALTQCVAINNFLSFKCFIPKSKLSELEKLKQSQGDIPAFLVNIKEHEKSPPSLFLSCEMIELPQEIVNTYGVPTYQEFNPAPLYIVTFGLFIGVMFGDVGHMLLAMILVILLKPNKWWWTVVFWMGYCGMIYNQFFGINLGWFQSCYKVDHHGAQKHHDKCVYPFGLDPVWKISTNQMAFTNSFKMKLSVIFGVLHMSLGIVLKGVNCIRKKNYLDLFTLVIPQLLFMFSTFIYMDILIIIKWLSSYKNTPAPSIINTLIGMFISNRHTSQYFYGQAFFQQFLMVLAIVLIPFLLFAKPFIIWISGNGFSKVPLNVNSDDRYQESENLQEEMQKEIQLSNHQELESLNSEIIPNESDVHDFKELMIHQLIETIEFVLGAVSNTASYLRLWALSLAHSQLSQVFFTLLLQQSLQKGYSSIFKLTIVFVFFIIITFGVLVCMDVMECFLHSLRLHWVQFQNKFFTGTGYLFEPYSFSGQMKRRRAK